MSVKIRLSRHGKKNYAFFHILATDVRAPRDSRFIELLGSYDPNTNPASIVLNVDRALYWLQNGAQPTITARRILSYKGVLLKKHLAEGVAKGALTQEQADAKFAAWVAEKEAKVEKKRENLKVSKADAKKAAVEAEGKVNAARAEELAKKKAEAEKAAEEARKAAEAEAAAATEAPAEEAAAPAEEAPKAE
ncbi:MAG: 30S ribosomal protein S16 [Bacteroidales bacterium]|nr:30S ribosomal protein S16 [Bacteroidales bacterium]MBP5229048.1 30S ribosomal protein S16 [Bacteroidales bacterium]MBR4438895.1 30S ribosomal protein S16 [Bacteroidales bacterium]MBR4806174.1 30S ribosomal protein S16 [Bacteroidales bacterium]MBR5907571.1 30S ribosomal protein S16 [Bacteroidales bacterium]